jgi:glycosyltransferase involved in cell wall biosynthesis
MDALGIQLKKIRNELIKPLIKIIITNLKGYRILYLISYLIFSLKKLRKNPALGEEYDVVFVIDEGNRGWILEAICREISNYFTGNFNFSYGNYFPGDRVFYLPRNLPLPPSKMYFFSHYSYFAVSLRRHPSLWGRKSFIYYTHPKGIMCDEEFAYVMNQSNKVICMCSQFSRRLVNCGVSPQKTTFVLGAADPDFFQPHQRSGDAAVGFCTAYYPRKEPERILNIIKLLPHRKFILLGKDWKKYERFAEMMDLSNLSYIQAPYSDYPQHYAAMDVFVSPAKLEGGPIPLIEAMMCNVVPVASKTGFAPDIITHGQNGFLFDVDSPVEVICELIEQAFQIQADIRKTVQHLTWKNFSLEIQKILESA